MSIFILQGISALWDIPRIDSIEFTFSYVIYIKCTTALQAAFWGDDEKLCNIYKYNADPNGLRRHDRSPLEKAINRSVNRFFKRMQMAILIAGRSPMSVANESLISMDANFFQANLLAYCYVDYPEYGSWAREVILTWQDIT